MAGELAGASPILLAVESERLISVECAVSDANGEPAVHCSVRRPIWREKAQKAKKRT